MILYIVLALVALVTMLYKFRLMRKKAEGFRIDNFPVAILALGTVSNVCYAFFLAEFWAIHTTWKIFLEVAVLFLLDLLIYHCYLIESRSKSSRDTSHYDITNDIKL